MATVEKRQKKNGAPVYRITVIRGKDSSGRQIRLRRTWEPPKPNMSEKSIEKALNRAVANFEREIEQGYRLDHQHTFSEYARYVIALKQKNNRTKPRTVDRYESLLFRIDKAIGHMKLTEITPEHLNQFYSNLSEEGIRLDSTRAVAKVNIKEWLKVNNTSAAQFSKRIGVASSTLLSASRGESIRGDSAEKIASGLGMSLNESFTITRDISPLSAKTVLEHHRLISSVMAWAVKERLIIFNPATAAVPPKPEHKKPDYYQPETVKEILDALDNAPLKWRAATYLLIDTGCRRGEVMGLKWDCVNLDDGIISVERALLYTPKKGVYVGETKTGETRVLQIAPETKELLKKWRAEQERNRSKYGDAWIDTGFVFTRDNGDMMNPDSLTCWLSDFSKAYDLPHIHPHAFRHTAASTMIANGVDLVTAAGELGHASATTTATIYAHQIKEAKAKAQNVRAGLLKR